MQLLLNVTSVRTICLLSALRRSRPVSPSTSEFPVPVPLLFTARIHRNELPTTLPYNERNVDVYQRRGYEGIEKWQGGGGESMEFHVAISHKGIMAQKDAISFSVFLGLRRKRQRDECDRETIL